MAVMPDPLPEVEDQAADADPDPAPVFGTLTPGGRAAVAVPGGWPPWSSA